MLRGFFVFRGDDDGAQHEVDDDDDDDDDDDGSRAQTHTRYEALILLEKTRVARDDDGFHYVGDGVFYGAYEATTAERLARAFFQYVEGSLFDWQLGDLVPSCAAGDIKISYSVQDPQTVSVLGVALEKATDERTMTVRLGDGGNVTALVHAGAHEAPAMVRAELADASFGIGFTRLVLFVWAVPLACLVGALVGRDVWRGGAVAVLAAATAVWALVELVLWRAVGAASMRDDGPAFLATALGGAAAAAVARRTAPPSGSAPGVRSVWCALARAAGLPPAFWVEASYRADRPKSE